MAVSMLTLRAPLEEARAKSILFVFDSCFSGTIFTDRGPGEVKSLSTIEVEKLGGTAGPRHHHRWDVGPNCPGS